MFIATKFEHLGLAVRRLSDAVLFLTCLGYEFGEEVYDQLQNVVLVLATHPSQPSVEIITPGNGSGPLDGILRHKDAMAYHCCYRVENAAETIRQLEEAGVRLMNVSPPKVATLFPGHRVSFYNAIGFGLFELLEPEK